MRRLTLTALAVLTACGGIAQAPECKKYIECAEAIMPGMKMSLTGTYGEGGTCWATNQATADACTLNCRTALEGLKNGAGANKPECN